MTGVLASLVGILDSGPTTLTYVADVDGATSLNIPGTAQAGDLAILATAAEGLSIAKVWPAGWTEVREDHDVDDARMVSGYKILTSGDLGTTITGMNDSDEHMVMIIFRPDKPINQAAVYTINGEATISNPAAQTIAMSALTGPMVGVVFMSSTTSVLESISPAVMTEVPFVGNSNGYCGYVIYNKANTPTNVVVDMPDEGDNVMQSWAIKVA